VLDVGFTAAVSRNRIRAYHDEATGITWRDVEPILTPSLLAGHRVTWHVRPGVSVTADGRYQGRSFLAPTGDERLTAPPFYALDGGVEFVRDGRALTIQGRNLLNRRAYPSGSVSGGEALYYIMAPRSVDVSLKLTR
jgi:hypothetical protein